MSYGFTHRIVMNATGNTRNDDLHGNTNFIYIIQGVMPKVIDFYHMYYECLVGSRVRNIRSTFLKF